MIILQQKKNKLAGIATGANKTTVDSAMSSTSTNPVQNKIVNSALSAKAPLASPTLTGTPKAPTAAKGTNTTQIATTAYVQTEVADLKKSVSDGKTLVATAITEKGVNTAADATFAVMANNISQIETGGGELHGATISVTTSEENPTIITVVLSKDSATIDQKNFNSNGLCTFTDIQESGDYTITASNEDISNSTTVTITSDNIVNKTVTLVTIEFTLDGSTATPLNDVSVWLRTDSTGSSLNAGHTTLAEVIADTTTLSSLMSDESAMKYLARSTGFADEGCASETFMTYLGASPYVDSTVLNSDLWCSTICDSAYFESVLNVSVPTMTSNTTPSGEAKEQSEFPDGAYGAWKPFDKNTLSNAAGIDGITTGYWVYYKFLNPVNVLYSYICPNYKGRGYIIQYSDDGNNWHDTNASCKSTSAKQDIYMKVSNYEKHKYWRAYCNYSSEQGSSYSANICELNFYGRE